MIKIESAQHRMVAPLFTAGVGLLLSKVGVITPEPATLIVGVASAASVLSATWADADLYVNIPVRKLIIRGNGIYAYKRKDGSISKQRIPLSPIIRFIAILFKLIGVKRHRDWKSHSPVIYVPLGLLLLYLFRTLPIPTILYAFLVGLVLGYWSHLAADFPNKGGLQFLPGTKSFSITKSLFGNKISGLFRSGSKFAFMFTVALFIEICLFALNVELAKNINYAIYKVLKGAFMTIFNLIKSTVGLVINI